MGSDGRKQPTDDLDDDGPIVDDENPEWTEEDFARAKPIDQIPELAELAAFLKKGGRPQLPERYRKRRVTIMLDPDVIEHFKSGGKGWQTRMNAALRKAAGL
jgi:uncharacterized protein (DUF4415 family)